VGEGTQWPSSECAYMLATKGASNETPCSNVQYLHPINEDTHSGVCVIRDAEESRVGDWKGDGKPQCTYVMTDGGNLQEHLSRDRTPERSPSLSAPVSDVQSDVVSELEDSDTQP
jgi:hypothetical protein